MVQRARPQKAFTRWFTLSLVSQTGSVAWTVQNHRRRRAGDCCNEATGKVSVAAFGDSLPHFPVSLVLAEARLDGHDQDEPNASRGWKILLIGVSSNVVMLKRVTHSFYPAGSKIKGSKAARERKIPKPPSSD